MIQADLQERYLVAVADMIESAGVDVLFARDYVSEFGKAGRRDLIQDRLPQFNQVAIQGQILGKTAH